jgi:hypothetical protein
MALSRIHFRATEAILPEAVRSSKSALVARQEPEADGDLSGVEKLAWERDHAVHEVGSDDGFPNLAFAGLVGGRGEVRMTNFEFS